MRKICSISLGLATLLIPLWPERAAACGGTFCDSPNPAMAVEQTGEAILFAFDGDYVEAHVQIDYDGGDASQFAWIVPVPAIPEIEVGSWRFIQAALDGSQPVYGYQNTDTCADSDGGGGGGVTIGFITASDGGASSPGDPVVVAQDTVGAFEYVVLQGGNSETVTAWLIDNGYNVAPDAPAILDEYIAQGMVFVAFRLLHHQGVEDLHPVVIRYLGDEPCIPLRLTAVAAKEDLEIRALFLGDARTVSTNYREVLLDRVRLDWLALGDNYRELVSMAVDTPGADGRAFVPEYAGASDVVDATTLSTAGYDASAFIDLPAVDVISVLEDQGLAYCTVEQCQWTHELVGSLLHEFLPVPEGMDEGTFYGCLGCYAGLIDAQAWSGPGFAAAYDERIVAPMQHGQELLATWPYLTRLYTTISPYEMIADPLFATRSELDDVPNRYGAEREQGCCQDIVRLPGGREVEIDPDLGVWPSFSPEMPWAERVIEYPPDGGPAITLVDASSQIDALLAAHNAAVSCDGRDSGGLDTGGGPPVDPNTTGPAGGDTDGDASSGRPVDASTGNTDAPASDGKMPGCACRGSGPNGSSTAWAWALALAAVRRRRSR